MSEREASGRPHIPELERLRRLRRQEPSGRRARRREGRGVHHRRAPLTGRRWPKRILITANVVCALLIVIAGAAYGYVQWRLGQIKRIDIMGLHIEGRSSQSHGDGSSIPPFTLLVIGSDTRAIAGGTAFGGTEVVQGQRSDSIILVRVVPKTRSLALLSIPRDTLVAIPGQGTTRINIAFNAGTPSLLVNLLDQDFGIQVNHVAVFNFDTFRAVADAVGGVEQWFPAPARDLFSNLVVPDAGCVNLTGDQALGFVRSREYQYYLDGSWHYQLYPESDLARIQRQQAFTRELFKKAKQVAPTDPITLNNLISGITKNLTVDSGFSNSLLLSLARDYESANLTTLPAYTYPAVNSTSVPGALDPETEAGQAVIQQWLDVGQAPPPPTPSPPSTVPPTTTVDAGSVSVEVLNGSGVGGQAGQTGTELSRLGYRVTVSGDAPNFGLNTTDIDYAPDSLAAAKQLQAQVAPGAKLVEDSALTPTPYNLELITGSDFKPTSGAGSGSGGSGRGSASSTTTTTIGSPAYVGTQTVDPASSSIYHGVYIPPGLTPGQTPQTCGV